MNQYWHYIFGYINLIFLMLIIWKVTREMMRDYFRHRYENNKTQMDGANLKMKEIYRRLRLYQAQVATLDKELQSQRKIMEEAAEYERWAAIEGGETQAKY